ncbi:hypothetical protein QYE76_040910 [Lolium multiflorum]|uniref:Uncharacterized protein n=1 Tax=Lolium multiflorum TaxID=4521 RepID=A0AAD8TDW1_LOLMU|nr:hypothetical protein QYE76_040910 [Lolium multiflorum]
MGASQNNPLDFNFPANLLASQNNCQLHEDLHKLVVEQKAEIERLNKKEAEDQQAIILLETRLKNNEELLAKRPSIDKISAKLEVLESEHESLQQSLKESQERETKMKKELEDKHAQAMTEMAEKLKTSNNRVKTPASKLKTAEAEATDIDELIFHKDFTSPASLLGFEWKKDTGISRTEAYEEARNSIDDLIEASRNISQKLSLKKARTAVIDTMTKLMKMVPELIRDWQESSAHGAAATALAMCKAHFAAMDFATIARGVPKVTNVKQALAETQGFDMLFAERVDNSSWYKKHDIPAGFTDDEEDDEVEGSGSSAHQSGDDFGDGSAKDSTYQASDDKPESSE